MANQVSQARTRPAGSFSLLTNVGRKQNEISMDHSYRYRHLGGTVVGLRINHGNGILHLYSACRSWIASLGSMAAMPVASPLGALDHCRHSD